MKCLRFLIFLIIVSATFAYNARERQKRRGPDRCPLSMSLCKCGRRGEVTCSDENCLQRLPTANMSTREGANVRSLFVTRQKDLLVIRNDDLGKVPNLRKVKLINNRMLGAIQHNAFQHTPNITQLDLHHNAFKAFPSAIRLLRNLVSLNLGGNQISYIPTSAFDNNPNLQRLILRRNKIESFPRALPAALVKLSMGQNLLGSLVDISHLTNLTVLRLNSNRLTRVHAGLLPTSLRELSVCQNLLTSQSLLSVDNLEKLRKLRLAGNPRFGRIARETFFKSTNQLRELDLRSCGIEEMDRDAFANLERLRAVDLSGNRLRKFDEDWLKFSGKLQHVGFANNTWHCTCDMYAALIGFQGEASRRASTNHRMEFSPADFETIECSSLDYTLRLSNIEAMMSDVNHKMAAYNFSTCPKISGGWELNRPRPSDSTTTQQPTTTEAITRKYTTIKPTATKTTTRKSTTPTAKTKTTTRQPTTPTPTTQTTTRKPTTTTRKPTTTRTTRKPTTTPEKPTTPSTTTKPTTTTTELPTLQAKPAEPARFCTESGDCKFPFTDGGVEYTNSCAPGTWGDWCKIEGSWDYCKPCT